MLRLGSKELLAPPVASLCIEGIVPSHLSPKYELPLRGATFCESAPRRQRINNDKGAAASRRRNQTTLRRISGERSLGTPEAGNAANHTPRDTANLLLIGRPNKGG